nr:hypothetical protein BaRGS_017871 [Batillaria attramentaria]
MSQFVHLKDKYGNDMWFGHPVVRMPASEDVKDYNKQLQILKDMELRSDDVITVAYPKSGLNWTNHMVTMLLDGTTEIPPVLNDNTFIYMDHAGSEKQLPPPVKPRALWSHLRFRYMPRDVTQKKVKVVYITRNPKDVFVSLFCYLKFFSGKLGYAGTWPQFFEVMLEQGYWFGDLFEYLRDWERETDTHPDLPIIQVSFEDLKQDTLKQVERLNEFLGTKRSEEFCETVAHTCRFSNMHVTRKFGEDIVNSSDWRKDLPTTCFFRKGEIGDWKNWFTVAQNEEFEKVYRTKMVGSKLIFRFE